MKAFFQALKSELAGWTAFDTLTRSIQQFGRFGQCSTQAG